MTVATRSALTFLFAAALSVCPTLAQDNADVARSKAAINRYLASYTTKDGGQTYGARLKELTVDDLRRTVSVVVDDAFAQQEFTDKSVKNIYSKVKGSLARPFKKYAVTISTIGLPIEKLVPGGQYAADRTHALWGDIDYDGRPWVSNLSRPVTPTLGLQNRHISLWASHGRYYDTKSARWKWQRPTLFTTNEDLFTQTIVVPFLIPMLENAGAVVFTPRERDWQTEEVIVDNDDPILRPYYTEHSASQPWTKAPTTGFAQTKGVYSDGDSPFSDGTCRMAQTTKKNISTVSYQPRLQRAGRHAVYVSYQTVPGSVAEAHYTVYHKGQQTEVAVNQKMGGGTWVYIGTYDFDAGCNEYNRVVVNNYGRSRGFVTTDAVRFGGGMGNIERGGYTSGLPRAIEGARYYAQWAGAPYRVYSSKRGTDDYGDDINTRSLMTNWLAGGSCYVPTSEGLGVPIELSLAVHSDAGYERDGMSYTGSMSICTTSFNDGRLSSGISRQVSRDFAERLLANLNTDLRYKYRNWNTRGILDRNYSETRLPEVPSAIIETLSHQNFPDMVRAQDPNFRFTLARSLYKTIVRYVSDMHGRPCVISPLSPTAFSAEITGHNKVTLRWAATNDPQEPTAVPTSYNIYTAVGTGGFDNGQNTHSTSLTLDIEPGQLYSFRVAAVNRGGESFPTQVLSVCAQPDAKGTVLIVDGFDRVSSPAIVNTSSEQGFNLDEDPGVSYGTTAGILGRQQWFSKSGMGVEGAGGLGYGDSDMAGKFVAGNNFDGVRTHAEAIFRAGGYNIVSCSRDAVESGRVMPGMYQCTDLVLGLQRYTPYGTVSYKTFPSTLMQKLTTYTAGGGRLLVSGAYVASDMRSETETDFLTRVLKLSYLGVSKDSLDYSSDAASAAGKAVSGLGMTFGVYSKLNPLHYAAVSSDIFQTAPSGFCAMQYADGNNAAVAYDGTDYRSFTMGFPFECIQDEGTRAKVMSGILNFLMKK